MKKIIILLVVLLAGCSSNKQVISSTTVVESSPNNTTALENTPSFSESITPTNENSSDVAKYEKINMGDLFYAYILDPLPENIEYSIKSFDEYPKAGLILISINKDNNTTYLCEFVYGDEERGILMGHTVPGFTKEDAILSTEYDGVTYYLWKDSTTDYGSYDTWLENNIQNQAPEIYQKLFIEKNAEYLEKYSTENLIRFELASPK